MAPVSLLYPSGLRPQARSAGAPDSADLALDLIVRALDPAGRHTSFIASLLCELNDDPATIVYRQQTLADLRRLPALADSVASVLAGLHSLEGLSRSAWRDDPAILQVAERLSELDLLVTCSDGLSAALEGSPLQAPGLLRLREFVAELRATPDYQALAAALPELRARLDDLGSVTLGVNLDSQFQPESATILALNQGRFSGKGSLLERLLGARPSDEAGRGVSTLRKADAERSYSGEHALFRDLSHMVERALAPVIIRLERFRRLGGQSLAALAPELSLFLGAARLAQRLGEAGLPLCQPELAPAGERACQIEGAYSLDLALRMLAGNGGGQRAAIVANQVCFDEQARVLLLTGPNSGGKTTYTRAIGQAVALFQAGLLVPGRAARISPADAIFSHFAAAERPEQAGGRLAEELSRLQALFAQVTPRSLLLINEPFTSTDHAAARVLARDLLEALRLLNARAVFVTHLHELAEEAIPEGDQHAGVASLIALAEASGESDALAPTYRVARGRPQSQGYARELARRYGLSFEQIAAALRERGVL